MKYCNSQTCEEDSSPPNGFTNDSDISEQLNTPISIEEIKSNALKLVNNRQGWIQTNISNLRYISCYQFTFNYIILY